MANPDTPLVVNYGRLDLVKTIYQKAVYINRDIILSLNVNHILVFPTDLRYLDADIYKLLQKINGLVSKGNEILFVNDVFGFGIIFIKRLANYLFVEQNLKSLNISNTQNLEKIRNVIIDLNTFLKNLIRNEKVRNEYYYSLGSFSTDDSSDFRRIRTAKYDRTSLLAHFLSEYLGKNSINLAGIQQYYEQDYGSQIVEILKNTNLIQSKMFSVNSQLTIDKIQYKILIKKSLLTFSGPGSEQIKLTSSDGMDLFDILSLQENLVYIRYNHKDKSYFKVSSDFILDYFVNKIDLDNTLIKPRFKADDDKTRNAGSNNQIVLRFGKRMINGGFILDEDFFVLVDLESSNIYIKYINYDQKKFSEVEVFVLKIFNNIGYSISIDENVGFVPLENTFNIVLKKNEAPYKIDIEKFRQKLLLDPYLGYYLCEREAGISPSDQDDDEEAVEGEGQGNGMTVSQGNGMTVSQGNGMTVSQGRKNKIFLYLKSTPSDKTKGLTANEIACSIVITNFESLEVNFMKKSPFIENVQPNAPAPYAIVFLVIKLLQYYDIQSGGRVPSLDSAKSIEPTAYTAAAAAAPFNLRDFDISSCANDMSTDDYRAVHSQLKKKINPSNIKRGDIMKQVYVPYAWYHLPFEKTCQGLRLMATSNDEEYTSRLVQTAKEQSILLLRDSDQKQLDKFRDIFQLSHDPVEFGHQLRLMQSSTNLDGTAKQTSIILESELIPKLKENYSDLVDLPLKDIYERLMQAGYVAPYPYQSVLEPEGPIFFFACPDWTRNFIANDSQGAEYYPGIKIAGKLEDRLHIPKCFGRKQDIMKIFKSGKLGKFGQSGGWGNWVPSAKYKEKLSKAPTSKGKSVNLPFNSVAAASAPASASSNVAAASASAPASSNVAQTNAIVLEEIKHDVNGSFDTVTNYSSPIVKGILDSSFARFCVNGGTGYSLLECILVAVGKIREPLNESTLSGWKNAINAKIEELNYPISYRLNPEDYYESINIEKYLQVFEFIFGIRIFIFANDLKLKIKRPIEEKKLYLRDSSQILSNAECPGGFAQNVTRFSFDKCLLLYSYNTKDNGDIYYDILIKNQQQINLLHSQEFGMELQKNYFSKVFHSNSAPLPLLDMFFYSYYQITGSDQNLKVVEQYLDPYGKCRAVKITGQDEDHFWLISKFPFSDVISGVRIVSLSEMKRTFKNTLPLNLPRETVTNLFCFTQSVDLITLNYADKYELQIPLVDEVDTYLTLKKITNDSQISSLNDLIKRKDIWIRSIQWLFTIWVFEQYINIYALERLITCTKNQVKKKEIRNYLQSNYKLYGNKLADIKETDLVDTFIALHSQPSGLSGPGSGLSGLSGISGLSGPGSNFVKRKFPYTLFEIISKLLAILNFTSDQLDQGPGRPDSQGPGRPDSQGPGRPDSQGPGTSFTEDEAMNEFQNLDSGHSSEIFLKSFEYLAKNMPNLFHYNGGSSYFIVSTEELKNKIKWFLVKELKIIISNLDKVDNKLIKLDDPSKDLSSWHIPINEYYRSKDDYHQIGHEMLFLSSYEFSTYQLAKKQEYLQLLPFLQRGEILEIQDNRGKNNYYGGISLRQSQHIWVQNNIGLVEPMNQGLNVSYSSYPSLYLQGVYDENKKTNSKYPYIIQIALGGKKSRAIKIAYIWKTSGFNAGANPDAEFISSPDYQESYVVVYSLSTLNGKELIPNRLETTNGQIITNAVTNPIPITNFLCICEYTTRNLNNTEILNEESNIFYSALLPL